MVSPPRTPRRQVLRERTNSQSNTQAAVRLVPQTPPRLLATSDEHEHDRQNVYSRTPLPTSSLHIFPPASPNLLYRDQEDQGYSGALRPPQEDVSPPHLEAKPQAKLASHFVTPSRQAFLSQSPVVSPEPRQKPLLRKGKFVALDPSRKTFKLTDFLKPVDTGASPPVSPISEPSYNRISPNAPDAEDRATSSVSGPPGSTAATSPALSTPTTPTESSLISDHHITTKVSSNYNLVGGLRQVPKTPDQKLKAADITSKAPPLPKSYQSEQVLTAKPSFQSSHSFSTTSDNTNYQVHGGSSPSSSEAYPVIPPFASSQIRSPAAEPPSSSSGPAQSLENYEVHGESPSTSHVALLPSQPTYSQESLVVQPLKYHSRGNSQAERLGYSRTRSRETLRTGSLTSISTVLSQREASRAVIGSPSIIHLPSAKSSIIWSGAGIINAAKAHMQAYPHQWSSQLSTVPSESEGGSWRGSGQSWSDARQSSGIVSSHRQLPSISSSIQHDGSPRTHSSTPSLEPPRPAFARNINRDSNSTIRMVDDEDENSDVITDLQDLRSRPSRQRLSGFFSINSSENGRTNTMTSTTSSRANSLVAKGIPTWAKVYYGSGERRYLGAPGSSTEGSEAGSRPTTSSRRRSGSPDTSNFPLSIYSPRRRPRDIHSTMAGYRPDTADSMEIREAPVRSPGSIMHIQHRFTQRVRSSSIWSPHLRQDRRAAQRSVWDAPSVSFSGGEGTFGRRNRQIFLFVVGFIFPFAWMVASFLPLPLSPTHAMLQINHSEEELGAERRREIFHAVDQKKYQSAKWWRNLNRWMSVLGLLIIAAIIVLVVIGIRQRWGRT